MAPPKFIFFVAPTSSFMFIFGSYCSVGDDGFNVSSAIEFEKAALSPIDDEKVNPTIFYKSFNLDSALFLVKDLKAVFDNDLIDILNLRLVPWGKAYYNKSNNVIICENGRKECFFDAMQACAIDVWKDVDKHFGFVYCIEFLVIEGKVPLKDYLQICTNSLGLPEKSIMDCYNSGRGLMLGHKYGEETMHLSPSLESLPWLVVNYKPIRKDYANFAVYVSKAYKGSKVPKACQSVHLNPKTKVLMAR